MFRPLGVLGTCLAVLFCSVLSAHGREVWSEGGAHLDVGGQLRLIGLVGRGTSATEFFAPFVAPPDFGQSCGTPNPNVYPGSDFNYAAFINCPAWSAVNQERTGIGFARLRLEVDARANENWSAFIAFDNQIEAGQFDSFSQTLSNGLSTSTLVDASGEVIGDHYVYRYDLYRGYLRFESRHFEAVVGRQRIPWGVGRLWNPIDRFNAIAPLQIQAQSPGVDAVNFKFLFTDWMQVETVFAPGSNSNDHDYGARLQGYIGSLDFGLMGGVFDGAPTAGLDLAANIWEAAGRAEIVYTHPQRDIWPMDADAAYPLPDFWQVVVSLDYNFDLGNGLYALVEYLYNGNALGFGAGRAGPLLEFFRRNESFPYFEPISLDRFGGSRVITRSYHLTGAQAGYDITPEVRLNFTVLYDWDGQSAVFYPALSYSPLPWLEVNLAVQGTAGQRQSEYGDSPTTGFLLADIFF